MHRSLAAHLLAIVVALVHQSHAHAMNIVVSATCNIYGAGHLPPNDAPTVGPHGGGSPPVAISLSALSNAPALSFFASGIISYCPACGTNDANGAGFNSAGAPYNGISGITNFPGRSLVGVFVGASEPADPAPPPLDFAVIGTNYAVVKPVLRQTFFIGNGLTTNGAPHVFLVPAGATRLFLGLVDGYSYLDTPDGYEDNTGSFTVTINPSLYLQIDYVINKPRLHVFGPIASSNRIDYATALTAPVWKPLTNVVLDGIPTLLLDDWTSNAPQRFYRAYAWP